ncbi:MAG: amidohydrolase [Desulfobacteraceae bacterium]|nr:MAG: amidohydrolase [Desulfobacteraceae bacterium]
MKIIDLEAHFYTNDYLDYLRSRKTPPREEVREKNIHLHMSEVLRVPRSFQLEEKLLDVGEKRLAEMDAAGVDIQVLSLCVPGCEQFEASDGVAMARKANDELAQVIRKYPNRYVGLAALAPQDPVAAANELERAVKELGMRGAKLNSHVRGEYLDNQKFWPVFEVAEKLDVPIYLHPTIPSPAILKGFEDFGFPLAGPPFGFGVDTSLHTMRMIYSGVFDRFPRLKIVLGHMGEGLPFWLYRIDFYWLKPWVDPGLKPKCSQKPSYYIHRNFLFTSSGMHYLPAFICAYMAVGGDVIAFGADHPFETSKESLESLGILPICDADKEKFYHGNAEKLLKLR